MLRSGVLYQQSDYIGAGKRLLIDTIDIAAAFLAAFILYVPLALYLPSDLSTGAGFTGAVLVWFVYFVLLKRSRFRTFGYRLCKAQIVNLQGERPSIGSLILRLLFAVVGPLNFLVDLFWIPNDSNRQAVRDKFAHTYVIRYGAVPASTGAIVYRTYNLFATTMLFQEVERANPTC